MHSKKQFFDNNKLNNEVLKCLYTIMCNELYFYMLAFQWGGNMSCHPEQNVTIIILHK